MAKIWMITSGGDWADAGAQLVAANDTKVDMAALHRSWQDWYKREYLPALRAKKAAQYFNFAEWLVANGHAREPELDEAEEFHDLYL